MIVTADFCSRFLPHSLKRLPDGRYIVLSRSHRPLGYPEDSKMRFENHPTAVALRISPSTAKALSFSADADTDKIYLYGDACAPTSSRAAMTSYLQRLALCATLGIE